MALTREGTALTRDHESVVSQQSLTRLECADSPFGLMLCGIAKANQRIRPPGLLRHPDTKGRLHATRKDTKSLSIRSLQHSHTAPNTLIG